MHYPRNLLQEFPLYSEAFKFPQSFQQNSLIEIEPSLFSDSIEDTNPFDLSSSYLPKKKFFVTKKNKTSFITLKPKEPKLQKKAINSLSKGRWTRQERIKFAFALYKYGTDWNKIKEYINTRNMIQLRSHGQKFLEKLKQNKFIEQKGLDLKNYNWKESIDYLKANLKGEELLNILYSIESELGDNNRMTEKYLERKRLLKSKMNLKNNEESVNTAMSTSEESNSYFKIDKKNENESEQEDVSYNFSDIISLDEDNNFKNELYKNNSYLNDNFIYNNFKREQSSIDEISFAIEMQKFGYKNKFNNLDHLFRL